MAKLTQKQERFALDFLKTGNAAEAYRAAYDCTKSKPETIWSARVAELRAEAVAEAKITIEGVTGKLAELRDTAMARGQLGPAVRAQELLGKSIGAFKDVQISRPLQDVPDGDVMNAAILALVEYFGKGEREVAAIKALLGTLPAGGEGATRH
jgi:hypothetical protein